MILYDLARGLKRKYKEYSKDKAGKYLSPVRRLEKVAPLSKGRFVAMTFDDGPSSMVTNPPRSGKGLTEDILDTLKKYGAKVTFDVIGTTEYNYPDVAGKVGSFNWGGVAFDHYPDFGMDSMAGVKNQLELVRRILSEEHELANHGFRHILFGKSPIVYGKRQSYGSVSEVIEDLSTLHSEVFENFGFDMKMSRPPHYVDNIKGGFTAYDAYRYMNYQYMAASFDGGGWQVSGDYQRDVEDMVLPLKRALEENPDSLNGQIIFQKDGCNMSKETPVADGLEKQLELLSSYGYKVVSVSELISMSPFEDLPDSHPVHGDASALINAGYCIARRNNRIYPEREIRLAELLTMCVNPQVLLSVYRRWVDGGFVLSDEHKRIPKAWHISPKHPYFQSIVAAVHEGIIDGENRGGLNLNAYVDGELLYKIIDNIKGERDICLPEKSKKRLTISDILPILSRALL